MSEKRKSKQDHTFDMDKYLDKKKTKIHKVSKRFTKNDALNDLSEFHNNHSKINLDNIYNYNSKDY